ncbi:MAG: hypothetical protein ACYDA8_13105, partial [Deferrisomatales bacterium]
VDGLAVRLVRFEDGSTSWELPGPGPGAPPGGAGGPPRSLPLDLSGRVRVRGASLAVEDRASGRSASLGDLTVSLDAPSLRTAPARLEARAELRVDGRALPPLSLGAEARDLFTPEGVADPARARASLSARLPGAGVEAAVEPGRLEARVDLELAELADALGPFLPYPDLEARGRVLLKAAGSGAPGGPLEFEVDAGADGVWARVPGLPGPLGPVDASLRASGSADPAAGTVRVAAASLGVGQGTRVRLEGEGSGSHLRLAAGPAELDLAELLALAAPFLPPGSRVAVAPGSRVHLSSLGLEGALPAGEARWTAEGVDLRLPRAEVRHGGLALALAGLEASLEGAGTLRGGAPRAAELTARLGAGEARVAGPVNARVRALTLGELRLAAEDLEPPPAGLAGRVSVRVELAAGSAEVEALGAAEGLRLEVVAGARLPGAPGGPLEARVERFALAAASARGTAGGLTAEARGASAGVEAAELAGPWPGGPLAVAIRGARVGAERLEARGPAGGGLDASASGLDLSVTEVAARVHGRFPTAAGFGARLRLGEVSLAAPTRASARGLDLPVRVSAQGLAPAPGSPWGVAGRVRVTQSLSVAEALVGASAAVSGLAQTLAAEARLGPGGGVEGAVESLTVTAPRARVADGPAVPVELAASLGSGRFRGGRLDLAGLVARVGSPGLGAATLEASARDSARERLEARGTARLDLGAAARLLAAALPAGATLSGQVAVDWGASGRLPSDPERAALAAATRDPGAAAGALAFLEALELEARLQGVRAGLPVGEGRLVAEGVATGSPLRLELRGGPARAGLAGQVVAEYLTEVPGLGRLAIPPRVALDLSARQEGAGAFSLRQACRVEPLALRQELAVDLAGLDRAWEGGELAPPGALLRRLEGTVRAALEVGRGAGLPAGEATWTGEARAGAEARLTPARELALAAWFETPGLDARLGDRLEARKLAAHLRLDKRYRLDAPGTSPEPGRAPLSVAVLRPGSGSGGGGPAAAAGPGAAAGPPNLTFDRIRVGAGGLGLDLAHGSALVGLRGGLPVADRFQVDLLGGTVRGSAGVERRGPGFGLRAGVGFSGLSARRLAPELVAGVSDEEAELGGRVALDLPLAEEARGVLAGLGLDVELSRIGRRALERALFALDPHEADETLVRARGLLRHGTPRWVRGRVQDGNLSLGGELEVKGARIELPRVDRLNLAGLPGIERFDAALRGLAPVLRGLEVAAAGVIETGEQGGVELLPGPDAP